MNTTLKYKTNLNCGSCIAAVKPHLNADPSIENWSVETDDPDKILTVQGSELSDSRIEQHLAKAGFKVLGKIHDDEVSLASPVEDTQTKTFLQTYKPLLILLLFLVGILGLVEIKLGSFEWMRAMRNFMGGFFISFAFFKLLDLRGFVDSFQTYDVVARSLRGYGYAYPFIELGLGAAYLLDVAPVAVNLVTLVFMLVGIVGVSQALFQKRQIQCACLGTIFNLPMSKVTFIEDGAMAVMAAIMLLG